MKEEVVNKMEDELTIAKLHSMKTKELIELAHRYGVDGSGDLRKHEFAV